MSPLKIVGGVYREICQFPERREILGSGGRAAAALAGLNNNIELHTFAPPGPANRSEIGMSLAVYGFPIHFYDSDFLISFRWLHGLASPQQEPAFVSKTKDGEDFKVEVHGDIVLRYGMVEGKAVVHAQTAIYDPQAPLRAEFFSANGSTAKRLAYIINSSEAKLLTGEADPYKQLREIHAREKAEVVVLKQGPHGALVSDGEHTNRIPCFKTDKVGSIGSGDVFSAVFSHFWAVEGLNAQISAYKASLATAFYCNAGYLPLPCNFADQIPPVECIPTTRAGEKRCIYLAGPFFTVAQRWLIDSLRETFVKLDVNIFSPIHDVGEGRADVVAADDLKGIVDSDVIFAVCDGLDAGTLFEIGYAVSLRKPVIAFTQVETESNLTMLKGTGCVIENDLDTAIYKAVWAALEK